MCSLQKIKKSDVTFLRRYPTTPNPVYPVSTSDDAIARVQDARKKNIDKVRCSPELLSNSKWNVGKDHSRSM
jgi:hypothetical protein